MSVAKFKTKKEYALWHVSEGRWVFPLPPNSKEADESYPNISTNDPKMVERWWTINPDANIGVYLGKFGHDGSEQLFCFDVDVKGGIDGRPLAKRLEAEGYIDPRTYTQTTTTGGTHRVHRRPADLRCGFRPFGEGIDCIFGRRYFVGAGSTLRGASYTYDGGDVLQLPQRFVEICSRDLEKSHAQKDPAPEVEINETRAEEKARELLKTTILKEVSHGSRNHAAFTLAQRMRDFGNPQSKTLSLLKEWDLVNKPPLNGELEAAVSNAYRYSKDYLGNSAPEKQFPPVTVPGGEGESAVQNPVLSPVETINLDHFLITGKGGVHICHEFKDEYGQSSLQRLSVTEFEVKFANQTAIIETSKGPKEISLDKIWLRSKVRREYKGTTFQPRIEVGKDWYNLWRGFAYEPKPGDHYALSMFLEHAKENVADNDTELFRWLIGYFAHIIQRPNEKPRTGLVFQGKKGVGKNALVDRVGALFPEHYLVTGKKHHLKTHFNAFMENKLMLVLNEVTWGGEIEADGILKGLVDGSSDGELVEDKYVKAYKARNLVRPVIIGNEPWLVKATEDERRYAVFKVGEKRRVDLKFFEEMRTGMESGGYRHLLHYLLTYDLTGIHINRAPETTGLLEQKEQSLSLMSQWWFDCLFEGTIVGSDFEGKWPLTVNTERLKDAYDTYRRGRGGTRMLSNVGFGKELTKEVPDLERIQVRDGERRYRVYKLPTLSEARNLWDRKMGVNYNWEKD